VLHPFYILDPILKSDAPPLYILHPVLWSDQPIISCIKAVLVLIKHLRTWLRCVNIIYNIKVTKLMFQICLPFQWCPLWRAIIKNMWNCLLTLNDLNFIYKLVSSISRNNWQIYHHFKVTKAGMHKTTYDILMIFILRGAPYPKRNRDVLGEPLVLNAPLT
jgi:hypothetical protein